MVTLVGGPLDGERMEVVSRYIEAVDETLAVVSYEVVGDVANYLGRAPRPDYG